MTNLIQPQKYRYEKASRWGIAVFQLLLMLFFFWSMNRVTFLGATLDDSWIHYQFVRDIALYGEVSFNPGEWSTGTTSLLWDLLLVPGMWIGIPPLQFSLVLGAILFLIFGQLVYSVFKTNWKNELNCILSMAVVLMTGNLTWYALSGMETILFLVIGLWWVVSFKRDKFILAGILAGAAMLTRIEGMLFLLMGLFLTFKQFDFKKAVKPVVQQIVFCIPVMAPSFALNYYAAGSLFPNTLAGKKWLYGLEPGMINLSVGNTIHFLQSWLGTLYQSNWWPELLDRPSTIQYIFLNIFSGGRAVDKQPMFVFEPYPLWLQSMAAAVSLVLFLILFRGLYRIASTALKNLFKKGKTEAWELLLYWFFCQNLVYLILMPMRGHGGRYQSVNFILFGLFIITGTDGDAKVKNALSNTRNCVFKPAIILVYFVSIICWGSIYANSVKHVNEVHRAAGEWMRDNIPPGTVIAAFDVGAIKYFSQLPIADIAGLTDRNALKYVLKGDIVPYMRDKGAQYLAMVEDIIPGNRAASPFDNEYYNRLGIRRQLGKTIDLIPVRRFEIPKEVWFKHWIALRTHSPAIGLYEIRWLENQQRPTMAGVGKNRNPQEWLSDKYHFILE